MPNRQRYVMMERFVTIKKQFRLAIEHARSHPLSEDEILLDRADRDTHRRLVSLQLLPIIVLMLVPLGFFIFTSNKAVLMVMILLLMTVYPALVSLVGACVTVKLGSHDVNKRREYDRLRQARSAVLVSINARGVSICSKSDVVQRARERRSTQYWNISKPRQQTGCSRYAR